MAERGHWEGDGGGAERGKTNLADFAVLLSLDLLREKHSPTSP